MGTASSATAARSGPTDEESGARAQWTSLERDTGNRWSGSNNSGGGALGMSFSREQARSANTVFSELCPYLPDDKLEHVPGQNEAIRNALPKGLGMNAARSATPASSRPGASSSRSPPRVTGP